MILMRGLIPRLLYPGRDRVGHDLTALAYPAEVDVFDGVDWHWFPSMLIALRFLLRHRPSHVVFEWWTGAVLHSFLLLSVVSRLIGARIVVEFHEVQDPGERVHRRALYVRDVRRGIHAPAGVVIHSGSIRRATRATYRIGIVPCRSSPRPVRPPRPRACLARTRAPRGTSNFLFFGTIRPYKGLEDLVGRSRRCASGRARLLADGRRRDLGGLDAPGRADRDLADRDRITFVNRYVPDAEVTSGSPAPTWSCCPTNAARRAGRCT